VAAAISGGVLTGLAAVGIDPAHFNLQSGIGSTMRIGLAAAAINSVIGIAGLLVLPNQSRYKSAQWHRLNQPRARKQTPPQSHKEKPAGKGIQK
jgi:hypothetical protein